jgi:hypothetical protein
MFCAGMAYATTAHQTAINGNENLPFCAVCVQGKSKEKRIRKWF